MKRKSYTLSRHQSPSTGLLPFEAPACVVYVIELDPTVMQDPAFAAKNPKWIQGSPCFYVGMTSLEPEQRYKEHLLGTKNVSRIAHRYGRRLRMDLVSDLKATRRSWAMRMEVRVTNHFRARGFGAWKG